MVKLHFKNIFSFGSYKHSSINRTEKILQGTRTIKNMLF
jgi:hypothetical protein